MQPEERVACIQAHALGCTKARRSYRKGEKLAPVFCFSLVYQPTVEAHLTKLPGVRSRVAVIVSCA